LGIENFKFAIVTEAGAARGPTGNVTGANGANGGKILPKMRNRCGLHCNGADRKQNSVTTEFASELRIGH
jgi:hypothetical protein